MQGVRFNFTICHNASEDENNKTQWIPLIQILNMANIDYSDWYILKALYKQLIV